jgi:hypothetical protein
MTTAGSANISSEGVGYQSVRIQGYAYGANGLDAGLTNDPDDCIFPNVNVGTEFGGEIKTKCRIPIMTGALGSTFIAAHYWDSFAAGAAICGFPIVVGENVVGVDRESTLENGGITSAPELDRRINTFLRYYDGHGAIIVQMNVEDTRNGVAEYLAEKYGNKIILELKWGQGAKDIGGEIQVKSLEYAQFLKNRGYVVDPDPTDPTVQEAFKNHAVTSFARHSRLGSTDLDTPAQVQENFMNSVAYLRSLGFKRISLKTGAYGMEALAMSIRLAADTKLDLLTIDGAGGGTGMSPWNMMDHWGVPSLPLHAKAYEYCKMLEAQGIEVPDISFAGGFAREDHLFKALALGAPYAKLGKLHGHWEELPASVKAIGTYPEEIFAGWEAVKEKVGADEMKNVPFGAVAMYGYADKLACGLQQFMAGARKFSLPEIARDDLMAANRETASETGLPYMTDAQSDKAVEIMKGNF